MAQKLLTDRQCRTAKPRATIYYLSDGSGLRLQIRLDGAKYWHLRYRLADKESTASLGTYPETSLEDARAQAAITRKLIAEGRRPTVERKVAVAKIIKSQEATFGIVADEWLSHNRGGWSAHHLERNAGLLDRILKPPLAALPITAIDEQMLLSVLRKTYDSGIQESARRARGIASQIFDFAKDTHRATTNPAREMARSSVLKKPPVKHFAALTEEQVGPMLRALDKSKVQAVTRAALLMMMWTGVRDAALRGARWDEFDLQRGLWTLPEERRKTKKIFPGNHKLPLPHQAVTLLRELAKLTHKGPQSWVFKSWGSAGHIAENTLRITLHRIGFEVTAHGMRTAITTTLNKQGFNADAIERQVDHTPDNKIRATYLQTDWYDYRVEMMQKFADWLDRRSEATQTPSNVVPMIRA